MNSISVTKWICGTRVSSRREIKGIVTITRERYIERIFYKPAKLRYQSIHCNLVDVDDPSRNFTTRKYTSKINGITLYNDDDLRSNHYLQRSLQYQINLLENEMAARKKIST
jgi:hypothetical protein